MAEPTVAGAGSDTVGENPQVHSKAAHHGMPRTPGKVERPGGTAEEPKMVWERTAPTSQHHDGHGTVNHYATDHPVMGGLHHGERAQHPYHDGKQAAYEKHGFGGKR
jgi:hypothetical protein